MPDKQPHKQTRKTALDTSRLKVNGPTVGTMIYILFGPIVWTMHLALIYGFQSSGCALSGYSNAFTPYARAGVTGFTMLALLALAVAIFWPHRVERLFGTQVWPDQLRANNCTFMRLLSALSVFAVLASGLVVLVVPVCASLR